MARFSIEPPTPSSGVLLPEVDGLRAVASTNVLACHALINTRWLPGWIQGLLDGAVGVQLFFVLSGFLLAMPFVRAHEANAPTARLGPYALRRMLRILPAYYVNLALCVLFIWPEGFSTPLGVATLAAHVTLTFGVSEMMVRAINGVYWSLAVEEQFYLILPLIARAFARRIGPFWLLLSSIVPNLVFATWKARSLTETPVITASLLFHWTAFAFGMLMSHLYVRNGRSSADTTVGRVVAPLAFVASVLVLAKANLIGNGLFRTQVQAIGSALFFGAVMFGPRWLGAPFRFGPVRLLGLLTFSVYLWHPLVAERVMVLSDPPDSALTALARVAVVFTFTLPFAIGSYLLVERPFMALRGRIAK